eukprot:4830704-Karenia_brevis.AAC.1
MRKVKGHASFKDVENGVALAEDKYGNDCADSLAVAGAAMHSVRPRERQKILDRTVVAIDMQRMMVEIIMARRAEENRGKHTNGDGSSSDADDIVVGLPSASSSSSFSYSESESTSEQPEPAPD